MCSVSPISLFKNFWLASVRDPEIPSRIYRRACGTRMISGRSRKENSRGPHGYVSMHLMPYDQKQRMNHCKRAPLPRLAARSCWRSKELILAALRSKNLKTHIFSAYDNYLKTLLSFPSCFPSKQLILSDLAGFSLQIPMAFSFVEQTLVTSVSVNFFYLKNDFVSESSF